jgi:hypothetical protein
MILVIKIFKWLLLYVVRVMNPLFTVKGLDIIISRQLFGKESDSKTGLSISKGCTWSKNWWRKGARK